MVREAFPGGLAMALATRQSGFGGIQPTSPTDFGGTAASPTTMRAPMAPGDPRRDLNDPWAAKGAGPGFTPPPTPATPPTPESQPQTFFEKFPTPQDAWKDWLSRMGQFLARKPGEVPNFPGPWGDTRTRAQAALAALPSGRSGDPSMEGVRPRRGGSLSEPEPTQGAYVNLALW